MKTIKIILTGLIAVALMLATVVSVGYLAPESSFGVVVHRLQSEAIGVTHASGLRQRPSNSHCLATRYQQPARISLQSLVPQGTFSSPVGVVSAPDTDNRLYVLEQDGKIWRLERSGSGTSYEIHEWADFGADFNVVFLPDGCHECGLYSMAFHPDFDQNGYIYFSFTEGGDEAPLQSHVARFHSEDGGLTLRRDVSGAPVRDSIYQAPQPSHIHNNGRLDFGPDGYLYVSFGDGGPVGDPRGNGQNSRNPYGTMLRLTDEGEPAPENDVPDALPEIYAYGLRNSWQWSFDRDTGDLWAGDVGDGSFEEVNRIAHGGNYGWACREGRYDTEKCTDESDFTAPVWDYGRVDGRSVTGGYVYRGTEIKDLYGTYLFADFGSGVIWGLERNGDGAYERRQLLSTGGSVVSFGEDHRGELYVVDYRRGNVSRIRAAGPPNREPIPEQLSDTGCVDPKDPARPAPGLIPYDVVEPFWSDAADKERYMALPDHTKIHVEPDGNFRLPVGSILVKNFLLDGRMIETRLLLNQSETGWIGYTYQWNAGQTDAQLLTEAADVQVGDQLWHYPSSAECAQCHTSAAGHSLGLEARQMDREMIYPSTGLKANQLDTLARLEILAGPVKDLQGQSKMPASNDRDANLGQRVRSYLHSNCSNCHRPDGTSQSNMDLRFDTNMALTNLCDAPVRQGDLGIDGARVLVPGDPGRSILWRRLALNDGHRMPPLGSHMLDTESAELVHDWIRSLDGCYTVAGPVDANFRIRNRATGAYLSFQGRKPLITKGGTDLWRVVEGEEHYRLQSHADRDRYLHAQRPDPQVGNIRPTWWSAEWELIPKGESFLIRNRWKDDDYLHAQADSDQLGFGPVEPVEEDSGQALWDFEVVE